MADKDTPKEDVIAKIKAKAAADEAAKEDARIKAEMAKDDVESAKPSPELKAAADAKAAEIEKAERDAGDKPVQESDSGKVASGMFAQKQDESTAAKYAKARSAGEKLRLIAMDYPQTTSDELVIFGRAGIKYTLGDLRDLVGIR